MTIVRVSLARMNDENENYYLARLTRAEAERRVADEVLVNVMLQRGMARRVPRCQSLSERDGDWNN